MLSASAGLSIEPKHKDSSHFSVQWGRSWGLLVGLRHCGGHGGLSGTADPLLYLVGREG